MVGVAEGERGAAEGSVELGEGELEVEVHGAGCQPQL